MRRGHHSAPHIQPFCRSGILGTSRTGVGGLAVGTRTTRTARSDGRSLVPDRRVIRVGFAAHRGSECSPARVQTPLVRRGTDTPSGSDVGASYDTAVPMTSPLEPSGTRATGSRPSSSARNAPHADGVMVRDKCRISTRIAWTARVAKPYTAKSGTGSPSSSPSIPARPITQSRLPPVHVSSGTAHGVCKPQPSPHTPPSPRSRHSSAAVRTANIASAANPPFEFTEKSNAQPHDRIVSTARIVSSTSGKISAP